MIKPKKLYFQIEGKIHIVTFKDTFTNKYEAEGIRDLRGYFYTTNANILFVW